MTAGPPVPIRSRTSYRPPKARAHVRCRSARPSLPGLRLRHLRLPGGAPAVVIQDSKAHPVPGLAGDAAGAPTRRGGGGTIGPVNGEQWTNGQAGRQERRGAGGRPGVVIAMSERLRLPRRAPDLERLRRAPSRVGGLRGRAGHAGAWDALRGAALVVCHGAPRVDGALLDRLPQGPPAATPGGGAGGRPLRPPGRRGGAARRGGWPWWTPPTGPPTPSPSGPWG